MATTYTGTGAVTSSDFHTVTFTGKAKSGDNIVITLTNAINMGNIDWTHAEKNDVVANITFTASYTNTDAMASSTTEPFTVLVDSASPLTGAASIMLGAGVIAIDGTDVALTRGGSQFIATREFRQINADGDRGPVKDRIVMESSVVTLTLNALTILSNLSDLYPSLTTTP